MPGIVLIWLVTAVVGALVVAELDTELEEVVEAPTVVVGAVVAAALVVVPESMGVVELDFDEEAHAPNATVTAIAARGNRRGVRTAEHVRGRTGGGPIGSSVSGPSARPGNRAEAGRRSAYGAGMIASTPEPPYVAVIFTSLRTEGDAGYGAMAARMEELAADQPGYLGIESARDGLGITVSYWATEADARAWKQVAEHAAAQQQGRRQWYSDYRVRVATVTRTYGPD
jgi:heme-degrading monooxygenase HmoA